MPAKRKTTSRTRKTQKIKHERFSKRFKLAALASIVAVACFGVYQLSLSYAAPAETSIYMAPIGKCNTTNAGNNGRVATLPICTATQVQLLVAALKSEGKAKGNIYLRMASDKGSYNAPQSFGSPLYSVAEPGYTFFVVPTWYTGPDTPVNGRPLPHITCSGVAGHYGMRVNRQILSNVNLSMLRVSHCTNGVAFNTTGFSAACPAGTPPRSGPIIGRIGPAMPSVALHRTTIEYIGNKYAPGAFGEVALNVNNVRNLRVTNSNMRYHENLGDKQGYIHSMYLKATSDVRIITTGFTSVSGSAVRMRHDNNLVAMRDVKFTKAGSTSTTEDWHVGKKRINNTGYEKACIELPSRQPARFDNVKIYGGSYNGNAVPRYRASGS